MDAAKGTSESPGAEREVVATAADKARVANYITQQSTTSFIFSIIMVLCAPQLLNPPAFVLALRDDSTRNVSPASWGVYSGDNALLLLLGQRLLFVRGRPGEWASQLVGRHRGREQQRRVGRAAAALL